MKIEFTEEVKIGDNVISGIDVKPLTFVELGKIWDGLNSRGNASSLQRARIKAQTTFTAGANVVTADDASIGLLPIKVAKQIITALDEGQGAPGEVLGEGDGIITPVLYKLGEPFAMKSGKGEDVVIAELEFSAKTYADIEDVLAADHDINKTLELLKLAKPVGSNLTRLPGWAVDKMTVADGFTIMTKVLPSF